MAITKLKHHNDCNVIMYLKVHKKHYAALFCKHHNTWIQWLSRHDYKRLRSLGVESVLNAEEFL
jgi:hypothetical protein